MSIKGRIATALHRAGALEAVLKARATVRAPLLTVLTYHHIADPAPGYAFDPDVADATPEQFRRQLETVARHFTVIGVDELIGSLDGAPLPRNAAMITFDDGYRSCLDTALPILREVGLRAMFFVATSFVSERRLYWWERIAYTISSRKVDRVMLSYPTPIEVDLAAPAAVAALIDTVKNTSGLELPRFLDELSREAHVEWDPELERRLADDLIMTWDDVRALADAGMDVESHSRTHRVLQTLNPAELEADLVGSRLDLEEQLGRPVRAIAFPVGRSIAGMRTRTIRRALLRAGYRIGFSNASGTSLIWAATDRFDLKRWAVDRAMSDSMFLGQAALPALGYRSKKHELEYQSGLVP
jgi:peptidoglycan/xylan/chitin deacetylase (PgdA/CDA1 family)